MEPKTVKVSVLVTIMLLITLSNFSMNAYSYELDEVRHVVIVAVSILQNGSYIGVSADLYTRVVCPGNGHVYVETLPLSQLDLQAATRVAAIVASSVAGINFNKCDFYASIRSDAPIVGGPSAGGITAVAFATALLRLQLNKSITMTGMIMPDGSIGPVGGIKYKLDAASSRGAKIFLVPYGQTIDYVYRIVTEKAGPLIIKRTVVEPINLVEYGEKLGVKVIPISNIYEALEIFTDGRYKPKFNHSALNYAIERLQNSIRPVLQKWVNTLKMEIENTINAYEEIEDEVLTLVKYRYPSYTYRLVTTTLNNLDKSIGNAINRASVAENEGSLYLAASIYLQALIHSYSKLYLLQALKDNKFIDAQREVLSKSIHSLINEIHKQNKDSIDMTKLLIAINILDRAYEAMIYVNRSLGSEDIVSSTANLAYASARYYTAKLWSELTNWYPDEQLVTSIANIKAMAMYIDTLARNMYAYLLSLYQTQQITQLPTEVDEALTRYNLAQGVTNDVDKLALGISSISYIYLALVSLFSKSSEVLIHVLNNTIYTNMGLMANEIPIDVVLYLEFAENLEDIEAQIIAFVKLSTILSIYRALRYTASPSTIAAIGTEQATEDLYKTLIVRETTTLTQTVTTTITYTITTTMRDAEDLFLTIIIVVVVIAVILLSLIVVGKKVKM